MTLTPRLICPRCRRIENEQFIYHALKRHNGEDARLGALGEGDGVLVCGGCGAKYPVVEGVAVVFREVGAVDGVVSPPWWPHGWGEDVWGAMMAGRGLGEGFGGMVGRVARYGWSGFWDCLGEGVWGENRQVHAVDVLGWAKGVGGFATKANHLVVGGGLGRELWECFGGGAGGGEAGLGGLSVLMDLHLPSVLVAKRLWEGCEVVLPMPVNAHGAWRMVRLCAPPRPVGVRAGWVCGDVLDPPFEAGAFDVISALNMLDSVIDPFVMLGQCHALLVGGGGLVLSSPFAWRDEITPPGKRVWREGLGGLLGEFEPGIEIVAEREFSWLLRHTDREATLYRSAGFCCRKLGDLVDLGDLGDERGGI